MKSCLLALLLLATMTACAPHPQTLRDNPDVPRVSQASALSVDDAFKTVQAQLVRCFGTGNYNLAAAPGMAGQPPRININGSLGHLFSTVDFTPADTGSTTTVTVGYALGRERRTAEWRNALKVWLVDGDSTYCQRMP